MIRHFQERMPYGLFVPDVPYRRKYLPRQRVSSMESSQNQPPWGFPGTPLFSCFGRGSRFWRIMRRWPQRACAEGDGDSEGDGGAVTGAGLRAGEAVAPGGVPESFCGVAESF